MRKFSLVSIFVFSFSYCFSQIPDTLFERYSNEYTPEKTYLHFDKSGYAPGETIWFKAYLTSGGFPSLISKNFYADFYDENGQLLKHIVVPIVFSTARNQFEVPAEYTGRSVTVKAYTQWMLNFDTAFIFSKAIPVLQKNMKSKTEISVTKVDFLPEGGSMVYGITSRVAFKAVDQKSNPVNVKGIITNNSGKTVAEFKSVHDGMGSFNLKPEKGTTYTAQWTNEFQEKGSQLLPPAVASGVVLNVEPQSETMKFSVERMNEEAELYSFVYIIGTIQGQRVYQAKVNLNKQAKATAAIPLEMLPDGVMVLTIFNKNWQPVAERAAFVRKKLPEFDADVKGRFNTAKRARNELEINLIDTLSGTFSIAVTDAEVFTDSSTNIFSHLLLSADIKGKIKNPAFYFQNTADSTIRYLDLVLLTNGWRRILWQDLTAQRLPRLWFQPDAYFMNFSGKIFGATPSQLKEVDALNLFVQTRDSSKQLFQVGLRPDGSFSIPELIFYDTVKVFYQFNKKNSLASRTSTKFDNGFRAELYKRLLTETNIAEVIPSDIAAKMQRYAEQQAQLEKLLKGTTLEGVTVRTRQKDPVQVMDDKYTSGLFSGADAYKFDVSGDVMAQTSLSVFNYLQGRVAGLQISNLNMGTEPSISWRGSPTTIFLNEMNVQGDQILNIPMSDVAYIKVFRPPFFGATGGGAGGAIAVYTKKGGDIKNEPGKGLEFQYVGGYTPIRQFYAPDYSKDANADLADLRSTIYWNPDVIFNRQNTQVKIPFFNSDNAKKLRIVIEGMDEEGKLFHYTRIIQ